MGLKDLKSRFDRHKIQEAADTLAELPGQTVAGPNDPPTGPDPSDGEYFSELGASNSPFDVSKDVPFDGGPAMDQMITLLQNTVTSNNHSYSPVGSITYQPSPLNPADFQDLNIDNMANPFVSPTLGIPIDEGPNAPGLRNLPYEEHLPN